MDGRIQSCRTRPCLSCSIACEFADRSSKRIAFTHGILQIVFDCGLGSECLPPEIPLQAIVCDYQARLVDFAGYRTENKTMNFGGGYIEYKQGYPDQRNAEL